MKPKWHLVEDKERTETTTSAEKHETFGNKLMKETVAISAINHGNFCNSATPTITTFAIRHNNYCN